MMIMPLLFLCQQDNFWAPKPENVANARTSVAKNELCLEMKILKCKECDKTFSSKAGFERHTQHHT